MAGRFEPAAGLEYEIARKFGVPAIRRALDMLEDAAKTKAPETRSWITMRDGKVRQSHMDADGQTIPGNLRFRLDHPLFSGEVELARHPRDPTLSAANAANCRCHDATIPHLLRESIHQTEVRHVGTRVEGSVETRFPRAAESEFGTDEDEAAHFMTGALHEVAMRLRSGHAR